MIEINNLTTVKIDEKFLRKVAETVLEGEPAFAKVSAGKEKELNLSIAILGPGRMKKLNKKYRGKNKVTDVLAFPGSKALLEKPSTRARHGVGLVPHRNKVSGAGFQVGPLQKMEGLGEIAICFREIKKNAKRFNTIFEEELARVLIHGILHLLGYDHEKDEKKAKEMAEKQNYYLKIIKI